MATALDIITDALIRDGIYASGETVSAADADRCLSILNDMIDSWSNESLFCYAYSQQSGPLVAGIQSYTIGTGGTFNMTRPLKLVDGPGAAYCLDANANKYAIDVVPIDQWRMIGNSGNTVTSNFPDTLFYDPQYPLGILNFFPYPNQSCTAYWMSYLQLTSFTSLTSVMSLPPGYKDALQKSLAIEIWPDFREGDPKPILMKLAGDAKAAIKRTNTRPNVAVYDAELTAKGGNSYSIYIDGPPR